MSRNEIFLSGALGLLIFLVYPVAPPRFLDGFVDTIDAADRSHGIVGRGVGALLLGTDSASTVGSNWFIDDVYVYRPDAFYQNGFE